MQTSFADSKPLNIKTRLKSCYQYCPIVFNTDIVNIGHINNIDLDIDRFYKINIVFGIAKSNVILPTANI